MGQLIDGVWYRDGVEGVVKAGELQRPPSVFRNRITAPGEGGEFPAEAGRYHLYVALACPWANRVLIMRNLKGLGEHIGVSVAHWHMGEDGWSFDPGRGVVPDDINGVRYIHELYALSDPRCTTRVTTPVLWDKKTTKIVSNESAEIVRMLNSAFDGLGAQPGDYYPPELQDEIDAVNEVVYQTLNNGVYRAGFASKQENYEVAVAGVFKSLDWLEAHLGQTRYLVGDRLTEADVRLFVTLVRFDPVYHGHFKCNLRALADYPALWAYTRDLYQHPAFRSTIDFQHIRSHYYGSHPWINPNGIVPVGPQRDFDAPSGRDALLA